MTRMLVIFAREPLLGRVKTRLASGTNAETAALIYTVLLQHTIETASRSGVDVLISLAEEPSPGWANGLAMPNEVQSGGDLGSRMAAAFAHQFYLGAERVVVIGSDNAHLQPGHIRSALVALEDEVAVLGPAEDGGYWLVGQRSPGVDLFTEVPWSSPNTLEVTRARLKGFGVRWKELETLPDIDTAEDLRKAIADPRVPKQLRRRLASALTNSDQ